jgi:hypothetical protein
MYRAMGFKLYAASSDSTSSFAEWQPRAAWVGGKKSRQAKGLCQNPHAVLKPPPAL